MAAPTEEAWLTDLYKEVALDLKAGRPLVVQVHVPLCDNRIIACGNRRLGDGDNPNTNLYWSTSGGFKGWFRSQRAWRLVHVGTDPKGAVMETRIWRRRVRPTRQWRRLGVLKAFDVYVVAMAWRGREIQRAMDSYVSDLYGSAKRTFVANDGTRIAAGGAAHVVAYVGHNGWMDVEEYDFASAQRLSHAKTKGTIAVACMTAPYLAGPVASPRRVPLLMTTSLLFAGAHSFEGAVTSFARGQPLRSVRNAAARSYAAGQGKPTLRVRGDFTNPSDRRWSGFAER